MQNWESMFFFFFVVSLGVVKCPAAWRQEAVCRHGVSLSLWMWHYPREWYRLELFHAPHGFLLCMWQYLPTALAVLLNKHSLAVSCVGCAGAFLAEQSLCKTVRIHSSAFLTLGGKNLSLNCVSKQMLSFSLE